jgi:lysophospholipase L1-like esterase
MRQNTAPFRIALGLSLALVIGVAAAYAADEEPYQNPTDRVPPPNDWKVERHNAMKARLLEGNADLLFIGDSITQGWEGNGKEVWDYYYADRNAVNLGTSGDRTDHVLWRLDDLDFSKVSPRLAVIMIGTNNREMHTAEQIAEGVTAIVDNLRQKLPEMEILLLGIFPREVAPDAEYRVKMVQANEILARLDEREKVTFLDIGEEFLDDEGILPEEIMPDALHPNTKGYWIWARTMEPAISRLLGEMSPDNPPKGYVALFNGKDLTGWKGLMGSPLDNPEKRAALTPEEYAQAQAEANETVLPHWSVVDGVITYDGKARSLCTAQDYADFELIVDWKIPAKGDSGIYLRGTPQVQIWDPAERPEGSGGLYNNQKNPSKPLVCADNPIGEWNTFHIKMVGERVTVYLNNTLVVNNVVMENYWNREIPIFPSEQIELQHHGSDLWFKNIYLREILPGEGWRPLFNGKDLTGWEQVGGKEQTWGAENGMLYTSGGEGGWLSTTDQFGDFELALEFRVPEGGNSGVFCRTPREGNPAYAGFEVQVLDDYAEQYATLKPWQYTGSVYGIAAPSRRVTLPAGTWQRMFIRCEGPKISIKVNGFPVTQADLSQHQDKVNEHPGVARTEGYIGLQNHGSRLEYRNIQIRELNK